MKNIIWLAILFFSCTTLLAASPEDVYRRAFPAVAFVVALGSKSTSQGSGVLIASNIVATNCHVIKDASTITVISGAQKSIAKVIYADTKRDVCLLSAGIAEGIPATLSNASDLRVGQRVYAIGAPRGLNLSLSEGLVSSLRGEESGKLIQTTAQVSSGSSGGGLFDDQGRLVGITTFKIQNSEGLNFALPSEWLVEAMTTMNKRTDKNKALAPTNFEKDESNASLALMTATSLSGGNCPFDTPPELPPKSAAWMKNYEAWRAHTNLAIFKAWKQNTIIKNQSNDPSSIDPARSIYYESIRAGIDPNMGVALVLYFGSSDHSVSKFLPISNATLTALKLTTAQRKDQFCWNPFALRTNVRIALSILKGYQSDIQQNTDITLSKYLEIDAELKPQSIAAISKDITNIYDGLNRRWQFENFEK